MHSRLTGKTPYSKTVKSEFEGREHSTPFIFKRQEIHERPGGRGSQPGGIHH